MSRPWRYSLLAVVTIAMWPAAARAEELPLATSESVPVASPTTVQLEASVAGMTEMTFAISSNPASGSLGEISSAICAPTATGGSDCTATVTYTPNACTSGPDSFAYVAINTATMAASEPATVALTQGAPAPSPDAPSLPATAAVSAGAPFSVGAAGVAAGATVEYGDGSGAQTLAAAAGGTAVLRHSYAAEGVYTATVTNHGACGTSSAASEEVSVVASGSLQVAAASAMPGTSTSITIPGATGLTAVLTSVPGDQPAAIFAATYAPANPLFEAASTSRQVLAGYDFRAIGVSGSDRAVVSFGFPDGGIPTAASLVYLDRSTESFVPVRSSGLVPDSYIVDIPDHTVSVVFDSSSRPSITELSGTRFALIAVPPALHDFALTPRCTTARGARSLRVHLVPTQRAALAIHVRRLAHVRTPARCPRRKHAIATRPGEEIFPLHRRLRAGVYQVTVVARNMHGTSRTSTKLTVVS